MPTSRRHALIVTLSAVALMLAAAGPAQAQDGPRWRAWLGCWSAVTPSGSPATASEPAPPILCVTPTPDPDVIEILAIADGRVASRDRLDASGRPMPIDAGGCTGTTRANWSADRRRVFLRSSVTCQGQPSETSAILAMAASGGAEWIDVRVVTAGGNSEVRVARYRDMGLPGTLPPEVASALRDRDLSVRGARVASTAQIGARDIIEASRSADPAIVEAWLLESGQRYAVDAGTLRDLADAGVPGRVTDAMVSASSASRALDLPARHAADDDRVVERVVTVYDPWGYGAGYRAVGYPPVRYRRVYGYAPIGFSFSLFGFGFAPRGYAYAPFGYYPYGYRPVAYLPFGFGYARSHGGRSYRPPVVIVRPGRGGSYEPRSSRPRVVDGQGYAQERGDTRREGAPGIAVQRPRGYSPPDARRDRPSAPARPDGTTRQGGQRDDGQRTAHRRP